MRKRSLWPLVMLWHFWRIATLRPGFKYLSDRLEVASSFLSVFFIVGYIRWAVLTAMNPVLIALGLALQAWLLFALTWRRHRSISLFAVTLGVSVVVDVIGLFLWFANMQYDRQLTLLEVVMIMVMFVLFRRSDPEIQRAGYRYRPHRSGY